MTRTLVLNGWAAGPETWAECAFARTQTFSYLDEMAGLPMRALAEGDPAVLVGFSMGGLMALKAFLAFPQKVRGLVLVSATPCMTARPAEGWAGMSERRVEALYLGTKLMHRGDPSPLYRDDNLRRGLDVLRREDLRAALVAARAQGLTARLPAAIVQGTRDGVVRPQNADFLASVFPCASVTRVPGGEHKLPLVAPAAVDAAVASVQDAAGAQPA